MLKFLKNSGRDRRSGEAAQKQLIAREMRFVLQQDVRRFAGQLRARLLDEGCNLHPDLARIMFYERFERRLVSGLSTEVRNRHYKRAPDSGDGFTHPQFYATVKLFRAHLPDAETKITAAVLDLIEALLSEWRRIAKECLSIERLESSHLQNLVAQIVRLNPDGHLAQHGLATIQRRLKLAIAAALMRHVRQPDVLREKYGSLAGILPDLGRHPALWPDLMAEFKKQIPYAQLVYTQTFWRTLNTMDTERPVKVSSFKELPE